MTALTTPWHACLWAHELTLAGKTGDISSLSRALFDAQVDLNPHQIEAAVFALSNPAQRGVLLADEVGLGKTIEAGLVLAQYWASRRRKLCVVCPAHLRVQWSVELSEKFHLPCRVIDARSYAGLKHQGDPFDQGEVVIISYAYAARMSDELRVVPFDLVVMDEAHKLRNAHKVTGKRGMAAVIHAFEPRKKLLLSATPIQNNLVELYGLAQVIDPFLFGSLTDFKASYGSQPLPPETLLELKKRLRSFCHRTLRSQVQEFVRYTKRHPLTQKFAATSTENELHDAVMAYFRRPDTYGLPNRVRGMMGMILCHMLASSPSALIGTLETIKTRVTALRDGISEAQGELPESLSKDCDIDTDELTEWLDEHGMDDTSKAPRLNGKLIAQELEELETLIAKAKSIGHSAKTNSLLAALRMGFSNMAELKAAKKALIFTESRRTQSMLTKFLTANGYAGKVICFNGENDDADAESILTAWRKRHEGDDRVTGTRAVDIRSALVEHFRDTAEILIATEAGAEGVNLQFCSLVINFDLPWNPQRIEQRIGRCHRYGQKHDVVVVNFLNESNIADKRIHDLLSTKFKLFDGIFGSSDDVLGAIEGGLDFERRVLAILQSCRDPESITKAFDALQQEMDAIIQERLARAKNHLIEHFDGEIHDRLKLRQAEAGAMLDKWTRKFWQLTQHALQDIATGWNESEYAFDLPTAPAPEIPSGHYRLRTRTGAEVPDSHLHRIQAPLGEWLVAKFKSSPLPPATLRFHLAASPVKISALEPEIGRSGRLRVELLEVRTDATEQFILTSAVRSDGSTMDPEVAAKLFELPATVVEKAVCEPQDEKLASAAERLRSATLAKSAENGTERFLSASVQINRWANESRRGAEREIEAIRLEITALERAGEMAVTPEILEENQHRIAELDRKRRRARAELFDLEDEIDAKRKQFISQLKARLVQHTSAQTLFEIHWQLS